MSAALVLALVGAVLQIAAHAHSALITAGDRGDLEQRVRGAVEAMRRDLLAAGAGVSGAAGGPLMDAFPPVLPARAGRSRADPELSFFSDRLSVLYGAPDAPQTALALPMAGTAGPLIIESGAPGCASGGLCGLRVGDRVLVYSPEDGTGAYDVFTVAAADAASASVFPASPLSSAYAAGARVLGVIQRTYYLDRPGRRLMMYDGDRSDLPLADHVVDLRVTYYGDPDPRSQPPPPSGRSNCAYAAGDPPVPRLEALGGVSLVPLPSARLTDGPACGVAPHRFDPDLLRIRRIEVSIRLEADSEDARGAGAPFAHRGTSRGGARYVPDLQVTFAVAPRNAGQTVLR